jgi:ribonuclease D
MASVALLQISSLRSAILIDIPALSKTQAGTDALDVTVGRLFGSSPSENVVVGFSCRQDISRLRSVPCARPKHWLRDVMAVIDLQVSASKLMTSKSMGLSRCCERFIGKPLDKAEQCSLWTNRPLSEPQRIYAALDAYVCCLIYSKIHNSNSETAGTASAKPPVVKKPI